MYETFRDFASPVATIIAACAAVYFTWRLGSRQAVTAQQQADIASMRLQYDLFDRRFRVYNSAKTLLVTLQNENILSLTVLDEYMRGTVDSIFFLDQTVAAYLDEVRTQAINLRQVQQRLSDPQSDEQRALDADMEARLLNWFHAQFPVLLEKFKPFLDVQESPLKRGRRR